MAAATLLVILASMTPPSGPIGALLDPNASGSHTYVLTGKGGWVTLSFPACSEVSVTWHVVVGGTTAVAVFPPGAILSSDCHGPPPSNDSWPSSWPNAGMDSGPVCLELGTQGHCTFTADQSSYTLLLYSPAPYSPTWPNVGNETVLVTISYAPPV